MSHLVGYATICGFRRLGPRDEQLIDDPSFSLSLSVQAAMRSLGAERDVVDIHLALGLPLLLTASPTDVDVRYWSLLARDAFLMQAAPVLGLTIRDLHPPEAARGLDRAAEFRQHFDASYAPLIRRALEHQQTVLAWQGWEGNADGLWGIITAEDSRGVGFVGSPFPVGVRTGDRHREFFLDRPPVQLYVVETVMCPTIHETEWTAMMVRHAAAALHPELGARFGVLTGAAAYRRWAEVLREVKPASGKDFSSNVGTGQVCVRSEPRPLGSGGFDARCLFRFLMDAAPLKVDQYPNVAHAALARSVLAGLDCFFLGLRKLRDFGIVASPDVQRLSDYARSMQQEMMQVREVLEVTSAPGATTDVAAVLDSLHRAADLTDDPYT